MIEDAIKAQDLREALVLLRANLPLAPDQFELRRYTAWLLEATGHAEEAAEVYELLTLHHMNADQPLRAIAAAKRLEGMGERIDSLLDKIALNYNANAVHGNPPTQESAVVYELDLSPDEKYRSLQTEQLVSEAHALASSLGECATEPMQLSVCPLLSLFDETILRYLLDLLQYNFRSSEEIILVERETPKEAALIVSGRVKVFRTKESKEKTITHLGPGSIVGLTGLIKGNRSLASARTVRATELLLLKTQEISMLLDREPGVRVKLNGFVRDRLLENVHQSSPFFNAIPKSDHSRVLSMFTGHELADQTLLFRERDRLGGIYLVLSGEVELFIETDDWEIEVLTLNPGELVGLSGFFAKDGSLVASRAILGTTLLYLSGQNVHALMSEHPILVQHFTDIIDQRTAVLEEMKKTTS